MNILMVQNDIVEAEGVADMIRLWGHDVDVVQPGSQMHGLMQKTDYAVVLMDIEFPVFLSCHTVSELKHLRPEVKIITLTALTSPESETLIRSLGIIYYLSKPFEPDELKTVLSHIADPDKP